jgi:hypothetical protein
MESRKLGVTAQPNTEVGRKEKTPAENLPALPNLGAI